MSIIDPQLVNIQIAPLSGDRTAGLRLSYQGKVYDLVRAFASHKLELAQTELQQLMLQQKCTGADSIADRYLLVREVGYYSLWEVDRLLLPTANHSSADAEHPSSVDLDLALQQASIWLFQELWVQWQDLLGAKQLQVFADNLLALTPQLQSLADLDRLLLLDPLASTQLATWKRADFIEFDRQLYHLTQKKIGHQFGTQLTIEIIRSMPDLLRSTLTNILDI
jgi:hypothetical protein